MTLLHADEVEAAAPRAGGDVEPVAGRAPDDAATAAGEPSLREAAATAFSSLGAAVMAGGIFVGVAPRIYACVGVVLGVALAVAVRRVRRPQIGSVAIVAGLFAIGLVLLAPSGLASVAHVRALVKEATAAGNVLRPPVPFTAGWQAILGWLMGTTGFVAAWVATAMRRPSLGLLLPLPVAAVAGISVPSSAQGASGIAVLVLFAVGLGLLSGGRREDRPPLAFELRRGLRAVPIVALICAALAALLHAHVLFPEPAINPAQKPQKPKTVPLSAVEDRVLFTVRSAVTGPWRIGSLDVYDGKDWRLPSFASSRLRKVPRSGVVDPDLTRGVSAEFTVAGLTGAVLPGLPNPVGIIAKGPKLAFDRRSGNIRTVEGQVTKGLRYTVVAAALPTVADLEGVTAPIPREMRRFTEVPAAPRAVRALIDRAPKTSKWAEFDFLRTAVLDDVVAAGSGVPRSIGPERAQEILTTRQGSPFEIVALQALLARWIGLPSRIGYGFDGGAPAGDRLEVRPTNGATFVEVWFPGYKWLPVIGTPKQAKPSAGARSTRPNPDIVPSDDISVKVYAFQSTPPRGVLVRRVRQGVLVALPLLALAALAWLLWPVAVKARQRERRRVEAAAAGPRARIALAYSEWRDRAADLGAGHDSDTPLQFVARLVSDEEHRQLAWLVTRALWGDLSSHPSDELAEQAEVLSRSLQRRLTSAQPSTIRFVAAVSRRSLRSPFDASATSGRSRAAA